MKVISSVLGMSLMLCGSAFAVDGGDGGSTALSVEASSVVVTGENYPGQPIDMPQRPVVYRKVPNGKPGIIDPPRIQKNSVEPSAIVVTGENYPGQPIDMPQRPVVYRKVPNGKPGIIDPPRIHKNSVEPVFPVSAEDCSDASNGLICFYNKNQKLMASTTANITAALTSIVRSGLEITPEGALVAGTVVGTVILISRYTKAFNPVGALVIGLGVAPVAASDYCSMYKGEAGFDNFINNLSRAEQIEELSYCPEMTESIIKVASQIELSE